jgi:putative ABC transport system substrate-binding protein
VRRRAFITLLGGAAAAPVCWPLTARAQQQQVPVIGYLHSASPGPFAPFVVAFRQGLREAGFVDGQNVAIEYRWAEGRFDRLPAMATELVERRVSLIVAQGGTPAALAAKAAGTIPIVFSTGGDPVKEGLVASLSRPGGNVTGISVLTAQLAAKRLEIMREVVPKADVIAMLANPANIPSRMQVQDAQEAARALGVAIHVLEASSPGDFEPAFAALARLQIGALVVGADPYFHSQRERIVALAARHAVPAIYEWREFAESGGLMSYGTNLAESYRLVGLYAGRILKGAKPADLPVMQATTVELVVNLRTAKTLGLTIPTPLLGRADVVIE